MPTKWLTRRTAGSQILGNLPNRIYDLPYGRVAAKTETSMRGEKEILQLQAETQELLRREESAASGLTEAEIAEFDRNHEVFLRGELKGIGAAESVKRLRKAQARNGEA